MRLGWALAGVLSCLIALAAAAVPASADPSWSGLAPVDQAAPFPTGGSLSTIVCGSPAICLTGDSVGQVYSSSDPASAASWERNTSVGGGDPITPYFSCAGTSLCVAADNWAEVSATTAPASGPWSQATLPSQINAMSCPSASLCVASTDTGAVLTSTNPTGPSSSWVSSTTGFGDLAHVTCPSTTLCVASDPATGQIAASTDPGGGPSAWVVAASLGTTNAVEEISCPSVSFCAAIDSGDLVHTSSDPAHSWSAGTSAGLPVVPTGISCGSASLCVVIGNGAMAVSTTPSGGTSAWTASGTSLGFSGISCPTASFCAAVNGGQNVLVSTDPSAGPGSYTPVAVDGSESITAAACAPDGFCVLADDGGNVLTSQDPATTGWTTTPLGFELTQLDCPSSTACLAIDATGGSLVRSADPGSTAWNAISIAGGATLTGLSCPSASQCFAVDHQGDVLSTTAPLGAAGGWASTAVSGRAFTSLSCPTAGLCVGGQTAGHLAFSTDPTGDASAWTSIDLNDPFDITAVACPSASLCLAQDSHGGIYATSDPTGGSGAWTNTISSSGTNPYFTPSYGLTCASAALCFTISNDFSGVRYTTDPTAPGNWQSVPLTPTGGGSLNLPVTTAVACASQQLCIAGDSSGEVAVGTEPSPPADTAPPAIAEPSGASGAPELGETLTETHGTWSGSPTAYQVQWQRCDGAGATCQPIAGATGQTYVPVTADLNATLRVTETASNAGGAGTATSAATAAVLAPSIPGTSQPPGTTVKPNPGGGTVVKAPAGASVTAAQLMTALRRGLRPSGRGATRARLRSARRYRFTAHAVTAGTETVVWTVPAAHHKKRQIGRGSVRFAKAGAAALTVRLTRAGASALKPRVRVTVTATFRPAAGHPVSVSLTFTPGGGK